MAQDTFTTSELLAAQASVGNPADNYPFTREHRMRALIAKLEARIAVLEAAKTTDEARITTLETAKTADEATLANHETRITALETP